METTRPFTLVGTTGIGVGIALGEDVIVAIEITVIRGMKCLHKHPPLFCRPEIHSECAWPDFLVFPPPCKRNLHTIFYFRNTNFARCHRIDAANGFVIVWPLHEKRNCQPF
jgi:hypothetical protein